jgi:hypothetical protein
MALGQKTCVITINFSTINLFIPRGGITMLTLELILVGGLLWGPAGLWLLCITATGNFQNFSANPTKLEFLQSQCPNLTRLVECQ